MSKPKVELVVSESYYHLFINGVHDPKYCRECREPGTWRVERNQAEGSDLVATDKDTSND